MDEDDEKYILVCGCVCPSANQKPDSQRGISFRNLGIEVELPVSGRWLEPDQSGSKSTTAPSQINNKHIEPEQASNKKLDWHDVLGMNQVNFGSTHVTVHALADHNLTLPTSPPIHKYKYMYMYEPGMNF
jgi:hypothetical protein